jgi:RNA polymerase sigma-B factor
VSAVPASVPAGDAEPVETLIARWRRSGDPRWRERAVWRGMPFARHLAIKYVNQHEPLEDLVQIANVGLVKAVDRFDPERGTRFSTFAAPTISGELRRHFRDAAWRLHATRSVQEAYLAVREASERMLQQRERTPTVRELAEATGLDPELVIEALQARAAQRVTSLDQPLRDGAEDGTTTLADRLGGEDARYRLIEESASLGPALARLTLRQRRILVLRFGRDRVQREIARELGCSQMQISRELRAALEELREAVGAPAERLPPHRNVSANSAPRAAAPPAVQAT